jgi:predicted DNA-binding transcriptional regulator AlpA
MLNRQVSLCIVLTATEAAKLLGISQRHFWRCHATGQLGPRPISLGRSKRWRIEELQTWLAAGAPARQRWDQMYPAPIQPNTDVSESEGQRE